MYRNLFFRRHTKHEKNLKRSSRVCYVLLSRLASVFTNFSRTFPKLNPCDFSNMHSSSCLPALFKSTYQTSCYVAFKMAVFIAPTFLTTSTRTSVSIHWSRWPSRYSHNGIGDLSVRRHYSCHQLALLKSLANIHVSAKHTHGKMQTIELAWVKSLLFHHLPVVCSP